MKTTIRCFENNIHSTFSELSTVLETITADIYSKPVEILSGATLGQHFRHIIELFQCLLQGYENGVVNYDKRKRDLRIESDRQFALQSLSAILSDVNKENKSLQLMSDAMSEGMAPVVVETNFNRELLYNLEHAIHHMALIRIGIQQLTTIHLPDTFGVAPSTIQYRKACAP